MASVPFQSGALSGSMSTQPSLRAATSGPIPNPPRDHALYNGQYATTQEAFDELLSFSYHNGFGIAKSRSLRKNPITGQCGRIDVICDRGASREARGHTRRSTTMRRDCQWTARLVKLANGNFQFSMPEPLHNHGQSDDPSLHQCHRKLSIEMQASIEAMLLNQHVVAQYIAKSLRRQFPNAAFQLLDVRNYIARYRRRQLGGLTPTQAFIMHLEDNRIKHIVRYHAAEPERVKSIFWTYPWCLEQWARFPQVLMIDNTYNTNRFKMPLYQAVGKTNTGMIFFAGFSLIDNERQAGYNDLMMDHVQIRTECGIAAPKVIITDMEIRSRQAVVNFEDGPQLQVCIFHLNKNVVKNIKIKWKKTVKQQPLVDPDTVDEEYDNPFDDCVPVPEASDLPAVSTLDGLQELHAEEGHEARALNSLARTACSVEDGLPAAVRYNMGGLWLLWKHMVYASNERYFDEAWAILQDVFEDQPAVLTYLRTNWLPLKDQWAHPWVTKYENYGCRTTSPTECANKVVKSYVVTGSSTIFQLAMAVEDMVSNNKERFLALQGTQKMRSQFRDLGQEWLGDYVLKLSNHAVTILVKQYQMMRSDVHNTSGRCNDLKPCTKSLEKQYGLPCAHVLLQRYGNLRDGNRVLVNATDCSRFWWLERSLDEEEPHLQIQDPYVNPHQRGRPRGGGVFATPNDSNAPSRAVPPSRVPESQATSSSIRRHLSQWEMVGDLEDEYAGVNLLPSGPTEARITTQHQSMLGSTATASTRTVRKRGRPKGSKNKPKPRV